MRYYQSQLLQLTMAMLKLTEFGSCIISTAVLPGTIALVNLFFSISPSTFVPKNQSILQKLYTCRFGFHIGAISMKIGVF